VHILYGEWYLYASPWLFAGTPVIATFHQPPEKLSRFLSHGPETGRVMRLVHEVTRNRFRRLAAAIVLTPDQRDVLAEVMPQERIHVIPLGTAAKHLISTFRATSVQRQPNMVLTVGEWLRDWDSYFACVRFCRQACPALSFVLVNRKLPARWQQEARTQPNLQWLDNASDAELLECYARASVLFLPLLEATGNNAVNEAMAAGVPIVSTVPLALEAPAAFCAVSAPAPEALLKAIMDTASLAEDVRLDLRRMTQHNLALRDWSVTAAQTMDLYSQAIRSSKKTHAP
jgi:glycosyltransferase involved in cell wall biosynthesis